MRRRFAIVDVGKNKQAEISSIETALVLKI